MFSDTTGEVLWSITQINDATLSMTSETADVTDAIGNVITQFDRSKNAEFSGTNALWDFGLSAAQFGSDKVVASEETKVTTPIYEQLKVGEGHKVTLSHTPSNDVKFIYLLNNDSTLGERYQVDATSTKNGNSFTIDDDEITLSEDIAPGTNVAVFYDYDASAAIMLQNNASEFPKAGKFMLEVIGKDTCDKTAIYVAYIVFPNAKLRTDMDLSFASDGGHPFSLQMMQDYCDIEKRLFNIYVDVGEGLPNVTPQPKPEPEPEPEPEPDNDDEPQAPPQDTEISDKGNRKISDLITPDTKIDENGKATGETHYIYHWKEFSTDDTANSGNFFPILLPEDWVGKKVKLVGSKNGEKTITVDEDRLLIQRLENLNEESKTLSMTLVDETISKSSGSPIRRIGGFIKKISESGAGTESSKTLNFKEVKTEDSTSGKEAVKIPEQDGGMDAVDKASKLIEPDVEIAWDGTTGTVSGTVHYYSFIGTTHFGNAPTGHYLPVVIEGHDNEEITATGSSGNTAKLKDPKWIIRVDDFITKKTKAKLESKGKTIAELELSKLTLESPATVPDEEEEIGLGTRKVKDIATDLETTFKDDVVHVTGHLHKFTGKEGDALTEFSTDTNLQKGHFVPILFPEVCAGKTVGLEGTATTHNVTFTKEDLLLVLRTDALTSTTVKATLNSKELLQLDLKGVVPVGEDAVSVPPLNRDFGDYGDTYDFLGDDVDIEWEGTNGKVTGTIKWREDQKHFSGDETKGHYYPLVLDDFFKEKPITVKVSNEKTATDTEWILLLDKVMNKDGSKKVTVKYGDVLIADLDFSEATLELPVGRHAVSVAQNATFEGGKQSKDFCSSETKIDWAYTVGSVVGTFYKQDLDNNYKLPLKFTDPFKEQTVIFNNNSGTSVSAVHDQTDKTLYLVTLGTDETSIKKLVLTIKCNNQKIGQLGFKRITCQDAPTEGDTSEGDTAEEAPAEEAPAEEAPAE